MPPLDLKKLRHGDKIKMKGSDEEYEVNGVYLSTDGIVLRGKLPGNPIVSRNCRQEDVEDHKEKGI